MIDELLVYSLEKMKEYGVVIFGDVIIKGIGVMID